MAENDGRKRMGDSVGKPFVIGNGDEGREGTDGRILPVYSIGGGTEGKPIYTIGENIGAGTVHKAAEVSD